MKNITKESRKYRHSDEPEMPTIAEFGAAKIREGFGILGSKFNSSKNRMKIKAEILATEAEMRKLASRIGRSVIKQIDKGDYAPVVSDGLIEETRDLLERLEFLKEQNSYEDDDDDEENGDD